MTKLEFVAENGNIRIDKYIADNEPSLTRTAAAKLIEQGKVFVNENSVGKNYKLKGGDRITLEIPDPVPFVFCTFCFFRFIEENCLSAVFFPWLL